METAWKEESGFFMTFWQRPISPSHHLQALHVCVCVHVHACVYHRNIFLPAAAKSRQSCPTLCNPIDGSPPGSAVPGILQARTLEWIAIFFSNAGKWKVKVKSLICDRLFATPWTAAYQAPPSMELSRQEYRSGRWSWRKANHEGWGLAALAKDAFWNLMSCWICFPTSWGRSKCCVTNNL